MGGSFPFRPLYIVLMSARPPRMNFDENKIGGSRDRVMGQLSHIENVTKWIPDLDAVFNIHDTPKVFVSAGHKAELEELIEGGECKWAIGG